MKRYGLLLRVIGVLMAVVLLSLASTPVLAYEPPNQGSGNATDVILWYSDNLTVDSVTMAGEVEITGLDTIADEWLAFVIVAFLIVIIFAYGNTILYALGSPVCVVYGFRMASEQTVKSSLWVAGVAIGILGIYFLFSVGYSAYKAIRGGR